MSSRRPSSGFCPREGLARQSPEGRLLSLARAHTPAFPLFALTSKTPVGMSGTYHWFLERALFMQP